MLESLKNTITQKLNPVKQAEMKEELEAIWAFRYRVCVDDMSRRDIPNLDHDNGWLQDDSDELANSFLFYTGTVESIKATIKLRVFSPGEVPEDVAKEYSFELFENINKRKIIEMSSFSLSNSMLDEVSETSLVIQAIEFAVEHEAEVMFVSCVPDHLQMYQDLGLRPYGGPVVNRDQMGLLIPLIGLLDIDYFEKLGSSLFSVMKKLERQGKKVSTETESITKIIYEASSSVENDRDVIKNEILSFFSEMSEPESLVGDDPKEKEAVSDEPPFSFLTSLPEQVIDWLAESGQLINIEPGNQVIQQDISDQEIYFLLGGLLEVRRGEDVLLTKKKGDTLGEVGFFRESGKRSASVYAVETTRLLVLRKSFLKRLVKDNPTDACAFYESLSRVMAEHIAGS